MPAKTLQHHALIAQLRQLRSELLEREAILAPWLLAVHASYRPSARNLAHYLALRHRDLRPLQQALDQLGLSSLGQAEADVLANLDKILHILNTLAGAPGAAPPPHASSAACSSRALLEQHSSRLFGAAPTGRHVRMMVTLPGEAAEDFGLVRQLVEAGMDIARINCAHDGPAQWEQMASNVRRAAKAAACPVRILMDLGGPKLRTGCDVAHASVLKLRPQRDGLGNNLAPALLGLRARGSVVAIEGAPVHLGVAARWLAGLVVGDRLDLRDAAGARRCLEVLACQPDGVLVQTEKTAYLVPQTRLKRRRKGGAARRLDGLGDFPVTDAFIALQRGSHLRLTSTEPGQASTAKSAMPAIACTLPQVFAQVQLGERIWFDDGRIGGVIVRVEPHWLEVEITHARDGGEKLRGDKGINLPDTQLDLPALTPKDIQDLAVVARLADMVGLSFVQRASDVQALRVQLKALGAPELGIMLKIETRRSFEHLAELLLAAMAGPGAGVMIARGDLAVECGYERMAELQEEILWAAEAAHMPVIWATQVLDTEAKTGVPTRAEITDAAMGERAECVMLNKGPHILEAMATLNDILQRMQAHQDKKHPLLRELHAWMHTPEPHTNPQEPA
jgi:pyruvate kinase